ncbi:hypothetical protein GCM10010431_33990 [Streptomyces kunmingensis]
MPEERPLGELGPLGDVLDRGPLESVAPDDVFPHFGWLAAILAPDQPSSAELTRKLIGWEPTRPGLLADLDEGHYFRQGA